MLTRFFVLVGLIVQLPMQKIFIFLFQKYTDRKTI